ncbi:hypothetical protein ACIBUR_28760 [Streptomyces anulatus]
MPRPFDGMRLLLSVPGPPDRFVRENADLRALVQQATADRNKRQTQDGQDEHERIEASWRERALNAEETLGKAQKEIFTQRQRIGELMGQVRDAEQPVAGESAPQLATENANLKRRVRQLSQEHRTLQERLEGARSNIRFAEKRIADLEAQLLEQPS